MKPSPTNSWQTLKAFVLGPNMIANMLCTFVTKKVLQFKKKGTRNVTTRHAMQECNILISKLKSSHKKDVIDIAS